MNYKVLVYSLILTAFLNISSSVEVSAQIEPFIEDKLRKSDSKNEIKNMDHVECVSYQMAPGDVAKYRIVSSDSIVVLGEPTLFRQRIEEHTLTCDSVINDRIFYSHNMTDYVSMESKGYVMDVKRTDSPWKGVTTWIEIDTMGNRLNSSSNLDNAMQSPGGSFQPMILPILDFGCRYIGEKWTFKNKFNTPETGFPAPEWDEHIIYAMRPPLDTLGRNVIKLELNKTALNRLDVPMSRDDMMQVVSAQNTFGYLFFDREIGLPIIQDVSSENKGKIYGLSEKPQEVQYYYDTKIILESYVKSGKKEVYSYKP
jgi:hypothetical protein